MSSKIQTLEYNKDKGTINLCTYSNDGFLENELDITDKVTTLVLDKLYDDYNLDDGDELLIKKGTTKKNKKSNSNAVEVTTN
ncbi:hypothetical protein [Aliarcobacter butzleri]|uniref:hypothetical protein n=1 Tax=Aliarcobacter butzleri TaxID=28197 RepID=UPI0012612EAB|nr:hypothetical protein [Aliarcobacter butzleri]